MPVAIAEGVILVFFLALFFSIGLVCLFTKKGIIRKIAIACVVGVFFWPIVLVIAEDVWEYFQGQIKALPARKVFHTRCATAGEKVYKTADDVQGILLVNIRESKKNNYNDLYWPDAALPYESKDDDYIRSFLIESTGRYIYNYVDVKEEEQIMRYRIDKEVGSELKKEPSPPELARYAVSFVNHDNTEDRKIGIAGTTITITDTLTGEKMAERTSYAFIPRLHATGFIYWGKAITCPKSREKSRVTRHFVNQVIKSKQEY